MSSHNAPGEECCLTTQSTALEHTTLSRVRFNSSVDERISFEYIIIERLFSDKRDCDSSKIFGVFMLNIYVRFTEDDFSFLLPKLLR